MILVAVLGGLLLPGAAGHASCRCRAIADYGPVWSPDDSAIAYTQAYETARVFSFANGSDTSVPNSASPVAFSPDWSRVAAVIEDSGGRASLFVFRADGSDARRLDAIAHALPVWSPQGNRLAYVGDDQRLYTIASDGSDRRLVAVDVFPYGMTVAAWSPDGARLIFTRGEDLLVVPARGGTERVVAHVPGSVPTEPAWSATGDRIAFTTNAGSVIEIVRDDGTNALRMDSQLPGDIAALSLSWSPDGKRLLYSHRFGGGSPYASQGVQEVDLATGTQRVVAPFGLEASYAHNGTRIAFGGLVVTEAYPPAANDCVGVGIWTVARAGGRPTLVTRTCTETPPTVSIHAPQTLVYGTPAIVSGGLLRDFAPFVRGSVHPCGRGAAEQLTPANNMWWSRAIEPRVTTTYTVASDVDEASATVVVSPSVVLRHAPGKLAFDVRVLSGQSFVGRAVEILLTGESGKSRLLRRVVLRQAQRSGTSVTSSARFRLALRQLHPWLEGLSARSPKQRCLAAGASDALSVSR